MPRSRLSVGKGYADECDLGHQYMPSSLIDPKSTLTGETPVMRDVVNWYFRLTEYTKLLGEYVDRIKKMPNVRSLVSKTIGEFLEPPVVHIKKELREDYEKIKDLLAHHTLTDDPKSLRSRYASTRLMSVMRQRRSWHITVCVSEQARRLFRSDLQVISSGA